MNALPSNSAVLNSPVNVLILDADILTELFVAELIGVSLIAEQRTFLGMIEVRLKKFIGWIDSGHGFTSCRHLGGKGQGKTVAVNA